MRDARFEGEAAEPPAVMRCEYCGGTILEGCGYYSVDTIVVCDTCSKWYAWAQFLEEAERLYAMPENRL